MILVDLFEFTDLINELMIEFSLQRAVTMIPAHDSPVAAMAFNSAGTKLSTASEKAS